MAAGLPKESLIGLSFEQLDGILHGLESGWSDQVIAGETGVLVSYLFVVKIRPKNRVSDHRLICPKSKSRNIMGTKPGITRPVPTRS